MAAQTRVSVVMCVVEEERMTQHTVFASCFLLVLIETEEKGKKKRREGFD